MNKLNAPNNLLRLILRKEKLKPLPPPWSKNLIKNRDIKIIYLNKGYLLLII